jgi:hypothetical protein
MSTLPTYESSTGGEQQTVFDTTASLLFHESVLIEDSLSYKMDSLMRTPSDTTFRFFEIKPEEKLFIGDARFPSDTAYYETILWHGLPVVPRNKQENPTDLFTIILLVLLALLASVTAGFGKYISSLFHAIFNYNASVRMYREKNYSFLHGAFRLEILFYISVSIFVYQIIVLTSNDKFELDLIEFGKTSGLLILFFLVKKLLYKTMGSMFIGASDTNELMFNMDNFYRAAGVFLFPVVAFIAFSPFGNSMISVATGVFIVVFFYGLLLIRAISILLKKQVSFIYLFLYLCTLEFLPLLLMYKAAVG